MTGSLVRVRWLSGEETTVVPAPGTLSVLAAGQAGPHKRAEKGAAKNTAGATKRNSGSRSAPRKKDGAK